MPLEIAFIAPVWIVEIADGVEGLARRAEVRAPAVRLLENAAPGRRRRFFGGAEPKRALELRAIATRPET